MSGANRVFLLSLSCDYLFFSGSRELMPSVIPEITVRACLSKLKDVDSLTEIEL